MIAGRRRETRTERGGRRRGPRRARGFTLVELLITLVVLLIGVYAMLRIFPRGYTAIEVAQQRTTAAELAEAEIARWKLHPESLPDAVVATDYEGNLIQATIVNNADTLRDVLVWGEMAGIMPGLTSYGRLALPTEDVGVENLDFYAKALIYNPLDLTPCLFDGAQAALPPAATDRPNTLHPNWQPNSQYLPRTMIGERIDIRRLGQTAPGVPFYLLSHPPLAPLRLEDDPGTPEPDLTLQVYVDVYDAQGWQYAAVPPGGEAALAELGAREFTLDGATGTMYFGPTDSPPADVRRFKVDYTRPDTLERVLGLTVSTPGGSTIGAPSLPAGVDPDTIAVHERLQQWPNLLDLMDEDPATARRNIFYVDPETTISGIIRFPRILQIRPEPSDTAVVKVDYRVYDWSILAFDVEVPADGVVRLPVGQIKGPSYLNPPRQPRPQEVARGIRQYYGADGTPQERDLQDPTTFAYVVAVDRQSGEILTDHEGVEWPPNPYERRTRLLVDYEHGLLDFNYEGWEVYEPNAAVDVFNRAGRTYRIFLRAQSDWAVQLMVAARTYGRSETGVPGGQPVGAEGGGSDVLLTYGWQEFPYDDPRRKQVYFPLSERGQAVAIDYYYQDPNIGGLQFIEGEVHTVGAPNVTDLLQWVCPLSSPLKHTPYTWGPVGVRGIGVRARATWVSPGREATLQDLVWALSHSPPTRAVPNLNETWHQVIVDTYLTRAPI
jgi:prepilin-type N-terminal cleavage/methylation domain-containing protein